MTTIQFLILLIFVVAAPHMSRSRAVIHMVIFGVVIVFSYLGDRL